MLGHCMEYQMHKIRVIPVLLLKDWGLEKSIRFRDPVYVGSPINAARVFKLDV